MTSSFDPSVFLDASISEPTVKRPPFPVGEYLGVIGEVTARNWTGKKDPLKSGVAWDVPLVIEVPAEVQASLGLISSTLQFKDSIMLDLTPNNALDNAPGRNGGLRRYREACDLNKPGDSFSARQMTGKVVKVKITHELYNDEIMERVSGVTKS